ncbi:hypothetical protein AX774_g3028 [Zancudomyces culisetae]|uniref:Uncharacterized protein n=1 Tax=Zancudomyces culisetae TaxID=1213189 RepID=A0A1R1PRF3_ZANCU|nr:hypothetical protein AX774_g3028 [Zancudomyces culisetae]|eukprot:OMH83472.1 hypothetical protein AX774_g3028 [Zancudomyces culisetae]
MSNSKVFVMTGGGTNLVSAIARRLALTAKEDLHIYAVCFPGNNEDSEELHAPETTKRANCTVIITPVFITLSNEENDAMKFKEYLLEAHGDQCIDTLMTCDNYPSSTEAGSYDASQAIEKNYFLNANFISNFLGLMKYNGRVILLANQQKRAQKLSVDKKNIYPKCNSSAQVNELLTSELETALQSKAASDTMYPIHCAGLVALARILSASYEKDPRNLFFASCDPEFPTASTQLPCDKYRSNNIEIAVKTPVYLATEDMDVLMCNNGGFFTRMSPDFWEGG